ncbi:MAG: hypothetical protein IT337_11910 [Thermomicrobiales bacterium]|nr:hypothetical protein [Thermomicrobiales bacterium]
MNLVTLSETSMPLPSRVELAALEESARYFRRAGARAGALLLLLQGRGDAEPMLEALRDNMLAGAALCEGMLELDAVRRPCPSSGAPSIVTAARSRR